MIYGYYETEGRLWCQVDALGTVCDMLSKKLTNNFKIFNSAHFRIVNDTRNRFGPWNLSLENSENGKYFLISYMDFLDYIYIHENFNLPKLVEIFATTGRHKDLEFFMPTDIIATPISNTCGNKLTAEAVEECYKKINVKKYIHNKPTFYGGIYGFRHYLLQDKRFDIGPAKLSHQEYIEDLHKQKMCFSLNGGEISPRDIEIMGLGNAIFRPKFRTTKTHNPLIPNYHYISVEHEDIPTIPGRVGVEKYWIELSDRIIERYNNVKNDDDFIRFVGENGRKWYEENGTVTSAANIIYNLLDFKKLE
jgi:hypothetical protein